MTPTEYALFLHERVEEVGHYLNVEDIGTHDRTLTLGLNQYGETFHAYVKDRMIHVYIYTTDEEVGYFAGGVMPFELLSPTGSANPELTDHTFARYMRDNDVPLVFSDYDEGMYYGHFFETFHGRIHE